LLPPGFDPRTDQPVTVSKFIIEGKKERRLSRQSLICIQKERDSILHVDPEVCCGWLLYFHVAAAYFRALIYVHLGLLQIIVKESMSARGARTVYLRGTKCDTMLDGLQTPPRTLAP